MKRLLDTNAWIEVLNRPFGLIGTKLTASLPSEIGLCSITVGELRTGAEKSNYPDANRVKVDDLVQQYGCLPFDADSADWYGRIRAQLERIGTPIGFHDTQIAAIAMYHNLIVVTHNTREFSRVPGLAIEDWQVP